MNERRHAALLAFIIAAAAITSTPAWAQVEAKSVWVRATVGGQKTTGAYMVLKSGAGATLVGVESPAAAIVEVHEMRMDGNVMRMRAIPRLELPAGKTIELKPGGYHVMLVDLKRPLKNGDSVPLRLKIEGKDKSVTTVEVKADVRESAANMGHH
jgi:periplasmic copper chaperone A